MGYRNYPDTNPSRKLTKTFLFDSMYFAKKLTSCSNKVLTQLPKSIPFFL